MPETKIQTRILSGNFEHPITLKKMQEWLRHMHSRLIRICFPSYYQILKILWMVSLNINIRDGGSRATRLDNPEHTHPAI